MNVWWLGVGERWWAVPTLQIPLKKTGAPPSGGVAGCLFGAERSGGTVP
jgi:hypothetical protein